MCKKVDVLRALVTERLTAAAEEIFALVERTIAEYEEELCRSKEENQRKQQLLDSVLVPQVHTTADIEIQTERSKEPSLVKQEEKNPEFTCVVVKSEVGDFNDDNDEEEVEPAPLPETEERSGTNERTTTGRDPAVQTANTASVEVSDANVPKKTNKGLVNKRKRRLNVHGAATSDAAREITPRRRNNESRTAERGAEESNENERSGNSETQETRETHKQDSTATAQNVQIKTETTDEDGPGLDPKILVPRSQTDPGADCDDWSRWDPQAGASSRITDSDDEDFNSQVQNLSAEMFRASKSGASAADDEGKVKHECPVCKKKLGRKQELKRHMLLHTGEKPFGCPVCDKRFIQKSNLKSHIVTHLDSVDTIIRHQKASESSRDDEWRRDVCAGRFSESENEDEWTRTTEEPCSSSALQVPNNEDDEEDEEETDDANSLERISLLLNQALNESKERKVSEYKCPICDKVFGRMENLRRHVLVHTGEKAFSCPVCNKQFTLKQHLKLHMVLHTRDKQFNCSVCAKTFIRKDNLRSHMRIHSADRPFGCSECGSRFFSDQDLERHKAVHGAERPFVCSVCHARFLTRRHLTRHEKIHKKDPQKDE